MISEVGIGGGSASTGSVLLLSVKGITGIIPTRRGMIEIDLNMVVLVKDV